MLGKGLERFDIVATTGDENRPKRNLERVGIPLRGSRARATFGRIPWVPTEISWKFGASDSQPKRNSGKCKNLGVEKVVQHGNIMPNLEGV